MPASNIIIMDGFDGYNTDSNISDKWVFADYITSIAAGRYGGNCIKFGIQYDSISKFFVNNQYACASFAFNVTGYSSGSSSLLDFNDSSSNQIDLRINSDGTLSMTRNGTSLNGGTTDFIVPINCWHWIEVKVMISNSITANSCQVKINGKLIINLAAGQSTQNTANSYINSISLRHPYTDIFFDDVIIQVGSGSDFLGDTRVTAFLPSGNGDFSDFVGSDTNSTDNYLLVDDINPDDDATYVESGVIGNKDLYLFPAFGITTSSITALGVDINCRKTDSGFKKLCSVARIGTTEQNGETINICDTYAYQIQTILPINPETNLPWNQSEAEALQLGQTIIL